MTTSNIDRYAKGVHWPAYDEWLADLARRTGGDA